MKAIILAAGYATRLYPLTKDKPKALLNINERPIIDYIIDELNTIPVVDMIYVVTNHKFANHFDEWAKVVKSNNPIRILDDGTTNEDDRKGAIGDILFTIQKENLNDDVIIVAGDNFFNFSLKDYYDYFTEVNADCVCAKEFDDASMLNQFAIALVDQQDNRLIDLEEKPQSPKSNLVVYANYIYKKETLPLFEKYITEGNVPDAPGYFLQWLYTKKDVFVYKIDGECFDIGTHKSYNEVQNLFASKK